MTTLDEFTSDEYAEWIIIKWLGDQSQGDISISRRARDDLKRRITQAIEEIRKLLDEK